MTAFDRHRPQDAPETILAANGSTVLHRYRVEGVIFAPNRAHALARLEHGAVYLDAALLLRDEQSVCAEHVPDYATGHQERSDAPCVVCGEPSVIVLPKIEDTP